MKIVFRAVYLLKKKLTIVHPKGTYTADTHTRQAPLEAGSSRVDGNYVLLVTTGCHDDQARLTVWTKPALFDHIQHSRQQVVRQWTTSWTNSLDSSVPSHGTIQAPDFFTNTHQQLWASNASRRHYLSLHKEHSVARSVSWRHFYKFTLFRSSIAFFSGKATPRWTSHAGCEVVGFGFAGIILIHGVVTPLSYGHSMNSVKLVHLQRITNCNINSTRNQNLTPTMYITTCSPRSEENRKLTQNQLLECDARWFAC